MARATLRSSAFQTVSAFVQETVLFVEFAVLVRRDRLRAEEPWRKKRLFCLQLETSGCLRCPIGL